MLSTSDRKTLLFVPRSCTELTIPGHVESIGAYACHQARSLRSLEFEKSSVTRIGRYAFSHTGLRDITFRAPLLRIGKEAFAHCYELEDVIFHRKCDPTRVGAGAFRLCAIDYFQMPGRVSTLKPAVFLGSRLKRISLPASLHAIPPRVFAGCDQLETVVYLGTGRLAIDATNFEGAWKLYVQDNSRLSQSGSLSASSTIRAAVEVTPGFPAGRIVRVSDPSAINVRPLRLEAAPPLPAGPHGTLVRVDYRLLAVDPDMRGQTEQWRNWSQIGGFGEANLYTHRETRRLSLGKDFTRGNPPATDEEVWKEIRVLNHLRHPAIVAIIGYIMPSPDLKTLDRRLDRKSVV
jgi:hypothetical protein